MALRLSSICRPRGRGDGAVDRCGAAMPPRLSPASRSPRSTLRRSSTSDRFVADHSGANFAAHVSVGMATHDDRATLEAEPFESCVRPRCRYAMEGRQAHRASILERLREQDRRDRTQAQAAVHRKRSPAPALYSVAGRRAIDGAGRTPPLRHAEGARRVALAGGQRTGPRGWRPATAYRRAAWDLGQGFAVYLLLYVHEQRCGWLLESDEPGLRNGGGAGFLGARERVIRVRETRSRSSTATGPRALEGSPDPHPENFAPSR